MSFARLWRPEVGEPLDRPLLDSLAPTARRLLAAYDAALRYQGGPARLRSFVRMLLSDHICRNLDELVRVCLRRAAFSDDAAEYREAADALGGFRASLTSPPRRRLVTLGVLLVFLFAFAVANFVFRSRQHARGLGDATLAILTFDRGALVDAGREFGASQVIGALFLCSMGIAAVLVVPALAFRAKRRLLMQPPDEAARTVYELEDSVFASLRAAKPAERNLAVWLYVALNSLLLWAAFVLVSFGILLLREQARPPRDVIEAACFFAVATAIVVSLVVDLRNGRWRRGARQKVRRWSVIATAAAAVLVALVPASGHGGAGPGPERGLISASLRQVRLQANISYGVYLHLLGISERGLGRASLARRGILLGFSVRIIGPPGFRVRERWLLLSPAGEPFPHYHETPLVGIVIPGSSEKNSRLNVKAVLLGDFGHLTKPISLHSAEVARREEVWIPQLKHRDFIVELGLFDAKGFALDVARTPRIHHADR